MYPMCYLLHGDRGPAPSSPLGHLGEDVSLQVLGEANAQDLERLGLDNYLWFGILPNKMINFFEIVPKMLVNRILFCKKKI